MAHAYTPGLKVSAAMRYRTRRSLPLPGEVLVKTGDSVTSTQVVARTFMPGDIFPINLANVLGISAGDVKRAMLKEEGETVQEGEPLARTNGFFGYFKTEYPSRMTATVESVSSITGQVILRGEPRPVEVTAFVDGRVVEVIPENGAIIEADVSYIQGIFGIGGEQHGTITLACDNAADDLTPDRINDGMRGAVVIGGARMTGDAVRKAIDIGAAAVISGGMDDQDLRDILGYDLGVAVTGSEPIGTTIIITEGFGDIAMATRTFELLKNQVGHVASVNGATQIRAGVMRPEIVVPLAADVQSGAESVHVAEPLSIGTSVRIIRDPFFGLLGEVSELPPEPFVLDSGSKARVLAVTLDSGDAVTVPRANVEIIGS